MKDEHKTKAQLIAELNELRDKLKDHPGLSTGRDAVAERATEIDRQRGPFLEILELIPAGIFIIDAKTKKPFYANRAATDLLGRGISATAAPGELAEVYQAYQANSEELYPAEKMPIIAALRNESTAVDDMEISRNGDRVRLQVFGNPIHNAAGEIEFAVAVFFDKSEHLLTKLNLQARTKELAAVTEELTATNEELTAANEELNATNEELRVTNEELEAAYEQANAANDAMRDNELRYRMLVESIPQKVFVKDLDGRYIICNQHYAADFNLKPADLIGKDDYEFYPRELAEKYRTDDRQVMESAKSVEVEEMYVVGGEQFWVHTIKTPVRDDTGQVVGIQGIFWDVTDERRRVEERENLLRSMGERIKELRCLHRVAEFVQEDKEASQTLQEIALLLPQSMQHDDDSCCRICLDDQTFTSPGFSHTDWNLAADILIDGEQRGRVEVCYLNEHPEEDSGPFITEEYHLVNSVAKMVGEMVARKEAKLQQLESHQRLLAVLDSLDAIVYVSDMDTHEVLFVNKPVRDAFGDIEGKICWQAIQVDQTGPCPWCTNDKLLDENGQPKEAHAWEFQNTINNHWYTLRDKAIRWVDGRIVRMEIGVDVTKEKNALQALMQSEARFRAAFESSEDCIQLWDRDYNFLYANQAAIDILGATREQVIGKNIRAGLGHLPDLMYLWMKRIDKVFRTGETMRLQDETEVRGREIITDTVVSPVLDDDGNVIAVCAVYRDISELKSAQEKLRRLNTELDQRVRNRTAMLDGVNRVLVETLTAKSETEIAKVFLAEAEQLTGSGFGFVGEVNAQGTFDTTAISNPGWDACTMPESDAVMMINDMPIRGLWGKVIQTGEPLLVEDPTQHPDRVGIPEGHPPLTSFMGVPLLRRNKVIGMIALGNKAGKYSHSDLHCIEALTTAYIEALYRLRSEADIQHANVKLAALNKELESFAYSVSHDLRAPLRAVDGFSLALCEDYGDQLDDTAKMYLDRLRKGAQRMAQLIDDVLTLSRVGRAKMNNAEVNLSDIAGKIAGELQEMEPGRNVEFKLTPELIARGDPRLLEQMLQNLLGNAWKFTGNREAARFEFGVLDSDELATQLEPGIPVYYVRDNGAGFDMKYVDKLFGAFQRLHRSEDFAGTGIGLATVQRIIDRHGGRIWAEGVLDQGATFYFTLWEMSQ